MKSNNVDQQLKEAAEDGIVELLYNVIQNDPSILERIDKIQFVETPLHIAASKGHIGFATEIMMLKPSFGCKLNQQGFSPIHLAMKNNQNWMVFCLVNMNKELVRVQGREGLTPLHLASEIGNIEYLDYFLSACPESIECLTLREETALHIAIKNEKFEALQFLVGWLTTNMERGATELENKILNQKDVDRNTILHISALINSDPEIVRLFVKIGISLKAKNLKNETALDMATNMEIKSILLGAGAKSGSQLTRISAKELISKKMLDKMLISILRFRRDILNEQRETWLIVATLVATATYESALSPPGGVYQADASDINVKITSSNSTISNPGNVGKSVLSRDDFLGFSFMNMYSFFSSTIAILILIPRGRISYLLFYLLASFHLTYVISLGRTSPTHFNDIFLIIFMSSYTIVLGGLITLLYRKHQLILAKKMKRSSLFENHFNNHS